MPGKPIDTLAVKNIPYPHPLNEEELAQNLPTSLRLQKALIRGIVSFRPDSFLWQVCGRLAEAGIKRKK
jgi:hypothetical protein